MSTCEDRMAEIPTSRRFELEQSGRIGCKLMQHDGLESSRDLERVSKRNRDTKQGLTQAKAQQEQRMLSLCFRTDTVWGLEETGICAGPRRVWRAIWLAR